MGGKRSAMPAREGESPNLGGGLRLREEGQAYETGQVEAGQIEAGAVEIGQALAPENFHSDSSIAQGLGVIREQVKLLTGQPGVYRMLSARGEPLYIGKAKNLRRRVTSYTHVSKLPHRLLRMVAQTRSMEIVTTHTEVEALLLESNLIKRFMPPFNVLLRDDKSFPYIHISEDPSFPQMRKHRGAQDRPGSYYGPFANARMVARTVTALEKAFLLRTCNDSVFSQRERPCLLYQIKRCSAPCVERISRQDYAKLVGEARAFLAGDSSQIQQKLAAQMEEASAALAFERAAKLRDRIRALTEIQSNQDINVQGTVSDADVMALYQEGGVSCIQVFFFRSGRNYGNRSYFPSHDKHIEASRVLASFIGQFYAEKPVPAMVLLSHEPDERDLIAEALRHKAERKVQLLCPRRGDKLKLIGQAVRNAREALERKKAQSMATEKLLLGIQELFELSHKPQRIEVYDNSHLQGSSAIGAMIVAGPEGFMKNAYRRYNIQTASTDDDYAMMREVLTRRFARAIREDPERMLGQWPDLVLIDGGKGQLSVALNVLAELDIKDLPVAAISKGPERDAGREEIHRPQHAAFRLPPNDPLLFYIQRLRDEAHNFAIGGHRKKRAKALVRSPLDAISGVGPTRKKALLLHFGSAKAVSSAGLKDLQAAPGISAKTAKLIYDYFHDS